MSYEFASEAAEAVFAPYIGKGLNSMASRHWPLATFGK